MTGFDPEGLDLAAGDLSARLLFPERVLDPARLRFVLVAMAQDARRTA